MEKNSIKIILERFLRKENLIERIEDEEVIYQFKRILGSNLIKYIDSAKFKDGTIYLKLTSSVLKNEISFEKTKIIEKVNKEMTKKLVKEIKFK